MGNIYPTLSYVIYVCLRDNLAKDPCSPNPCHHDDRCVSHGEADFECDCVRGYTGFKCESKSMSTVCVSQKSTAFGQGIVYYVCL